MSELTQTSEQSIAAVAQVAKDNTVTHVLVDTFRRLIKKPLGLMGLILVSTIVLSALFASVIAPYDPIALDILNRLKPPSSEHWLGTDQLGRDTFSRVLYGGQIALHGHNDFGSCGKQAKSLFELVCATTMQ